MTGRSPQQIKLLRFLAAAAILILSAVPFFGLDPRTINYTGLFQSRPVLTWCCMGPALLLQSLLFLSAAKQHSSLTKMLPAAGILFIGVLALMVMPYRAEHDLSTNLHLLLAFAVLVLLNILVLKFLLYEPRVLRFYAGGCLLAFFTALTASSINGLSELIYAAVLTISISLVR